MINNSHLTAIVRKKISLPTQYLLKNKLIVGRVLDYGCGRGFDADQLNFDKYDPYYFKDYPNKKYDTIICNYVLNVIPSEEEKDILKKIEKLLKKDGCAYITVRRDKFKEGFTSKKTYQRYVELDLPVLYEKKSSFIIYNFEK